MPNTFNNKFRHHRHLVIFMILSTFVLFLGLYRNQWNAARDKKFRSFDQFSESLIMGRLVESRQNGIFSHGALIGMGNTDPVNIGIADVNFQYETYLNNGHFETYFSYLSQSGFQAIIYGLLDRLLNFPPTFNLRLFRGLTSFTTAITLGMLITWIYYEFGLFTALISLLTTIFSQWITFHGRNIFWNLWVYYLPLVVVLTFLAYNQRKDSTIHRYLFWVVFFTILAKCLLSGYDFIPTTAASIIIPMVYFAVLHRWKWINFIKMLSKAVIGTFAAIFISLILLAGQIGRIKTGFWSGAQTILDTLIRRSYGNALDHPGYGIGLDAKLGDVIVTYLMDDVIFQNTSIRFLDVIILFLCFTLAFIAVDIWKKGRIWDRYKGYALIFATWVAFFGSLSMFVVFKSMSIMHTHLYYVAWHMPFTIFGFTLCGYILVAIFANKHVSTTQANKSH